MDALAIILKLGNYSCLPQEDANFAMHLRSVSFVQYAMVQDGSKM